MKNSRHYYRLDVAITEIKSARQPIALVVY
jgi:hypothetical protein